MAKLGRPCRAKKFYDGYPMYFHKGYEVMRIDGREIQFHKYLWEKFNGKTPDDWVVHHKNRIKNDNRLENLEAMSKGDHVKTHADWVKENGIWVAKPCSTCKRILPLDMFYKKSGKTIQNKCKECHDISHLEYMAKHPNKAHEYYLTYYAKYGEEIQRKKRESKLTDVRIIPDT